MGLGWGWFRVGLELVWGWCWVSGSGWCRVGLFLASVGPGLLSAWFRVSGSFRAGWLVSGALRVVLGLV